MTSSRSPHGRPYTLRRWLRFAVLVLAILVLVSVVRLYRALDFAAIGDALSRVQPWQVAILLLVLAARQLCNAAPLAVYIPGVSIWRATANDLSASTASAFAPPPSDMVLRVALFRSWGVPLEVALAGTTMNAITLFIVRFGAPLGAFLLTPAAGVHLGVQLWDIVSLTVCAALIGGVIFIVRGAAQARALGRRLGRLARGALPRVDPEAWAAAFTRFQNGISAGFARRFPAAIGMTACMVFSDLMLLVLALRWIGIEASDLPAPVIAVAFLFAYPLTLFPMQGAGAVDAAILSAVVSHSSAVEAEPVLAALIVWRVFTIAGPLLLGLVVLAFRKHL